MAGKLTDDKGRTFFVLPDLNYCKNAEEHMDVSYLSKDGECPYLKDPADNERKVCTSELMKGRISRVYPFPDKDEVRKKNKVCPALRDKTKDQIERDKREVETINRHKRDGDREMKRCKGETLDGTRCTREVDVSSKGVQYCYQHMDQADP